MTERALIRRELVRQTALLFFVFALLFALLGAGVYSMVSSNIYRNADENLQAIGMESDYITLDAAGSGSAIVDDVVVEEPDGAAPSDATAIDDLSLTLQQSIVDADPQFITLIRNEQGDLLETVGLYASYPSFLRHIPFDKNDLERVYQIAAGGHEYRGITYAASDEGETTYLQTLVNVDSEIAILDGFTRTLIVYLAAAVVVAAGASYLLSRRTLKPIVANMRAQTEFVQNASHELRTPLAVIQTTGELLLDSPNSRILDRFEDVNAITSETKRLARLVDDLMELSLGDAGRSSLDASAVNLDALVRDACAAYEDFATLQDKRLEVETGSRETIEADADKLRQLLGIVLDNALKYTAPGDEITVRTRASGPKQCVVEVADTGCGIDPEDLAHVFERFYRADKARSRETGGYGLGLSLAQHIVEAHGGSIALEPNEPRGTVVVVTLPANASKRVDSL